ncbi:MAG: hypothetical protein J0M11_06760 [Anaerolineae bacterium]|nr:hypothetical protein [Anaerolineae bacterium]
MPVIYKIFPEQHLIIYVGMGLITPTEFFKVGDEVLQNSHTKENMMVILDFFNAELETSVADIHLAIFKNKEAKELGKGIGKTAVYTRSATMKFLGEALRQISFDSVTNFSIFHNRRDTILWLGLPEELTIANWETLIKQNETA